MANKTWQIDVGGQKHVIEVKTGSFTGGGSVTVDGKVANKWGASISGLPSIKFEVQGKQKSKAKASWVALLYCILMEKR